MSTGNQPAPPSVAPAKTRSPIERAIVWGGILVLLVLVGIEFNWKRAHESALETLLAKVKAADDSDQPLKAADVKAFVGGKTPRVEQVADKRLASNARRVEIYTWPTLNFLGERALYVYYGIGEGDDAEVLSVTTGPDEETADKFNKPLTKEEEAELMKKAYIRPQKTPPAEAGTANPAAGGESPAAEKPADGGATEEKEEKNEK
ncbi:MAG TPA: hypothetical protein VL475_09155 [Planctomycetaceae bacterium]|nr:hypothetical protein [Planctomycetaceae bacterium]